MMLKVIHIFFAFVTIGSCFQLRPLKRSSIVNSKPNTFVRAHAVNNFGLDFDTMATNSNILPIFHDAMLLSDESVGYSSLSLYFTLALYVLTLPGLYSLVTRSVKVTLVRKVFDLPGPANPTARPLRQTAAEFMAYFKALNYEAAVTEEVITFKGIMGKSKSQAAFLTFCTFIGLGSLSLVLSILLPDVGTNAYFLTLISPYAGIFYWNNAQRPDEFSIKMETSDDEQITSIIAQGGKEDMDRFAKTLNLPERGKIYVKGLFDTREEDLILTVAAASNEASSLISASDAAVEPKQE